MKTNTKGIALIRKWEGLRTKAYQDVAGIWTIGYGHTSAAGSPKVTAGMVITEKRAEEILKSDLKKFEDQVSSLVKIDLNENQFAALVSFHYNTGALGKSTLLKKINSKDFKSVPGEFLKWVNAGGKFVKGLQNRREEEVQLWLTGVPQNSTQKPAEPLSKPAGTSLLSSLWTLLLMLLRGK